MLIQLALSAFAARKALRSTKNAQSRPIVDEASQNLQSPVTSIFSNATNLLVGPNALSTDAPLEFEMTASKLDEAPFPPEDSQLSSYVLCSLLKAPLSDLELTRSSFESRGQSPEVPLERPSIALSNFKPDKNNVKLLSNDSIALQLAPGEVSAASSQVHM